MELYEEDTCLHALNRIFGYRPKTALALIRHFGSAAALYADGGKRLKEALPYTRDIEKINDKGYADAQKELRRLKLHGCRFLGIGSETFPSRLEECPDTPVGLYIRSESPDEEIFAGRDFIAVVGTRDISPYGKEWCRRIVSSIAACSATIVSGLAIGTDIAAHRTALECGTPTIAVLPTGIDNIYPLKHRGDADRIVSSPGSALITDFPPGTAASKYNFLRRNRIIAGLCRATVLVESKIRGGGMMTARLAFSYDRDVLALPGRVDDLCSQGCNLLIQEKIADPITAEKSPAEILCLESGSRNIPRAYGRDEMETDIRNRYEGRMHGEDIEILASMLLKIKRDSGITIEELAGECGIGYVKAAELAGLLECDGIISTDLMRRCRINI